jgi:predicted transcriptional regulator
MRDLIKRLREAIDTDFSDPAAKLDAIEQRMLKALVGRWMDVGQLARAVKADPARVRVRLDNLMELERVERKAAGDRLLYTVAQY